MKDVNGEEHVGDEGVGCIAVDYFRAMSNSSNPS